MSRFSFLAWRLCALRVQKGLNTEVTELLRVLCLDAFIKLRRVLAASPG